MYFGFRKVPDITWYKGDVQIEDEKNGYHLQRNLYNRILSIRKVDRGQHEGRYKCLAQNERGTIESDSTLRVLGMSMDFLFASD